MAEINVKDIELLHGDCLTESSRIADGSIDLILTDLPYGTVKGVGDGVGIEHGMAGRTGWDIPIDPIDIYEIANRILRMNGKMILFSQEPYTTKLINEAIPNVPFSYRMIWEKDHFANSLIAKKAPVSYYEDVLVFSKDYDEGGLHPLRGYAKKLFEFIGVRKQDIKDTLGHQRWVHFFQFNGSYNKQFGLCSEDTYEELRMVFGIERMEGFLTYEELKNIDYNYRSVFNLWRGNKFKSNIFKYKKDYDGFHPTQKPVALLEDLIQTFSNSGDLVVDLTMGSGSTGVASINTGRRFTGVELDEKYYDIANQRIQDAIQAKEGEEV